MKRLFYRINAVLFFIACIFPYATFADIYKQIDKHGNAHFSDKITNPAELIQLQMINGYSSENNKQPNTSVNSAEGYRKLMITSPINQQTFQNQSDIPIIVDVQPDLKPEDTMELWLDGKFYQRNKNLQFNLDHIDRGEHQLEIKINDSSGQTILTSEPIVIFIHYSKV